jgi:Cu2+-exporting ATPase
MTALADPHGAAAPSQAAHSVVLSVPGMRCAACMGKVEKTLAALPGVAAARVNLGDKQVRVTGLSDDAAPLIAALDAAGFEAQELDLGRLEARADPEGRALLMRIGVSGFGMMNVMILSVAVWSGAGDATRDLFHWISAVIALPAVIYASRPFFASALSALRRGRTNMDVPISLALILATGISVYQAMIGGHHAWFEASLSLALFLLIGRYLDHRTRRAARSAASALTALEVPRAIRMTEAGPVTVPTAELVIGDVIRVLPGARIPVDAEVIEGRADLDRSLLTGESLPVAAGPGARVAAGETVLSAPLTLRATAVGEDTSLRRMAAAVSVAEGARNRYVALADRASRLYAPMVHSVAALGFLGWYLATGEVYRSLLVAIALLIITCPCALGLAVPAVSVAASSRLFQGGVLLKSSTALERLAEVDAIVLDKTGTLTTGTLTLDHLDPEAASVALALAQASDHPVSRAVALALQGREPATLQTVVETPGEGVSASWRGRPVRLGRGASGTELRLPGRDPIPLAIREELRPGAEALIAYARKQGLPVTLLSGDRAESVRSVAERLGIEDWRAGVSPQDKLDLLTARGVAGAHVLMVGDGLNDAGALAAAHVSIAPASALDAARAASDAVLLAGDLAMVGESLSMARQARSRMVENFRLAALYNVISIPIALAGFATPMMAALAMSTSSILVVTNALRLRSIR